jgi:hypothetical protein
VLGKFFGTQIFSPLFVCAVSGGSQGVFGEKNGLHGGRENSVEYSVLRLLIQILVMATRLLQKFQVKVPEKLPPPRAVLAVTLNTRDGIFVEISPLKKL